MLQFMDMFLWLIFGLTGLALIVLYVAKKQFLDRRNKLTPIDENDGVDQAELERLVQEVNDIAEDVNDMNVAVNNAVKSLREAADYLDQLWKDCKVASAMGSSSSILGGVLTAAGGVATIMTAGTATPLLIAGAAIGGAGACVNLGASFIEASANSSLIEEADAAVANVNREIDNVRNKIRSLKDGKNQLRLLFVAELAGRILGVDHLAVALIKGCLRPDLLAKVLNKSARKAVRELAAIAGVAEITTVASRGLVETGSKEAVSVGVTAGAKTAAEEVGGTAIGKAGNVAIKKGSRAVGKAGAKSGAKAAAKKAGGLIIGVSAAFLVLDTIELTFTVRDIIKNEGSSAARCVRRKADELQAIIKCE